MRQQLRAPSGRTRTVSGTRFSMLPSLSSAAVPHSTLENCAATGARPFLVAGRYSASPSAIEAVELIGLAHAALLMVAGVRPAGGLSILQAHSCMTPGSVQVRRDDAGRSDVPGAVEFSLALGCRSPGASVWCPTPSVSQAFPTYFPGRVNALVPFLPTPAHRNTGTLGHM